MMTEKEKEKWSFIIIISLTSFLSCFGWGDGLHIFAQALDFAGWTDGLELELGLGLHGYWYLWRSGVEWSWGMALGVVFF